MKPILGIDFGKARVGLAISDELRLLAHPLETVSGKTDPVPAIVQIVRERNIERVVVGVPKSMSGQMGTAAEEAMKFVETLRKAVPCEVVTWDERLTTVAAHRALRDAGKRVKDTRGYIDQVAAQMILQGYLDRQQTIAEIEQSPG